ncbi:type II toxin-antitoxin system PemK/MazF family toxin [Rhodopseudomonas palustris]|uniref:Type II toxin-antitoxin system PemK/MazF family toxin n=2 Tax=Rhodopseudomonas palustris TaxID=1076 RepID=A0A418VFG6_RHOPL|nr:type II toxin-antitoxin system PemK/MazF family toxin [Rhodopseudomonas palustris]RJF74801.1 type II toxin-antitoxin system PemK/MazF family toxin [Rhodopseudomonas palustris]
MMYGDLITVALRGEYGKPRPALIVQSNRYAHLNSVTVLPLTSHLTDSEPCRVMIAPSPTNGLRERSLVMVDKAATVLREKTGPVIGRLSPEDISAVNRALAIFLGIV